MRKINRPGEIRFPDFRLYYKGTVIKTVWYLHKKTDTSINGAGRKAKTKTTQCGQVVYEKGEKNTQCTKDNLFKNGIGKIGQQHAKELN